jgi:ectoine hydroxylase
MHPPPIAPLNLHTYPGTGLLLHPELLGAGEVTALRTEAERLRTHLTQAAVNDDEAARRLTWWRLADGGLYLFKIKPVADLSPLIAALARDPRITALLTRAGHRGYALMEDKITYKQHLGHPDRPRGLPVLGEEVRKHTDADYFRRRGHHHAVSLAVLLDDCTPEAGAMRFWPGSHRTTPRPVDTPHQGPVITDADAPESAAITPEARAGSVLLWDAALIHASAPNTSGRPRRLLVFGYAPTPGEPE